MNQQVKFEIAKLLKEKGFDFPRKASQNDYQGEYPTIAEVVMWLYEKHGIWIWIACREFEDGGIGFIPNGRTIPFKKKNGVVVDIIPYMVKTSPTEAYEAAIEHILNKLI